MAAEPSRGGLVQGSGQGSEAVHASSSSVPEPPDLLRPGGARYRRILLKLSGEVFGGGRLGVDPDVVATIARQIAEIVRTGVQVAVVVGGGNYFRGLQLSER